MQFMRINSSVSGVKVNPTSIQMQKHKEKIYIKFSLKSKIYGELISTVSFHAKQPARQFYSFSSYRSRLSTWRNVASGERLAPRATSTLSANVKIKYDLVQIIIILITLFI